MDLAPAECRSYPGKPGDGHTAMILSAFVEKFVRDFLASPGNNILGPGRTENAWEDVVLGYSNGADGLYSFWKEHIGEFHWTPEEAFQAGISSEGLNSGAGAQANTGRSTAVAHDTRAAATPSPEELTVIAWALSHTEAIKVDNRRQSEWPSEAWARARVYGQSCVRALHRALVVALAAKGYSAVAPGLLPQFAEILSEGRPTASSWSERHIAYTSGLGTFGLCGGLITPLGKAVRLGSVIVKADIPSTPRPYSGAFDYCLHLNGGACTACADRCPVGSVGENGRDKGACARHLQEETPSFVEREYGFKGYGCGLCQTGVPCESGIPVPSLR
jgi:epoxyqueuosine reductase